MSDAPADMSTAREYTTLEERAQAVEALCFTLNRPLTYIELAKRIGISKREVREAIIELSTMLEEHALMLQYDSDEVQMVTRPHVAGLVQDTLAPERPTRLSPSALETLAIIAYRQPITKGMLDYLRGVDCERVLERLEGRGLIAIVGHDEGPGSPRLWGTTLEFLRLMGIATIEELPPLSHEALERYERAFNAGAIEDDHTGEGQNGTH
ncbi:MAG: SMC-Scp complex subunit ScpB [Candidatus Dormibacteria bacterium]